MSGFKELRSRREKRRFSDKRYYTQLHKQEFLSASVSSVSSAVIVSMGRMPMPRDTTRISVALSNEVRYPAYITEKRLGV